MNGWDPVLSVSNNWERSKFRMKTKPSTSVKLIKDVV
jgi:hypothetical protein